MKVFHKVGDEEIFKEFCFDRGIRKATISGYKDALQKYSNFTGKTLEELIIEAENDEENGLRLKRRKINKYLRNFELYLRELDFLESTVEQRLLLVKSFYRHNEIELPRNKKTGVRKARKQETIEDLPKMEEIRRFMEHCNSVYKAMIVMGISSGMGSSEVTSLTFRHLYKATELKTYPETIKQLIEQLNAKGDFIPTWKIIRIKKNHEYTTFSSPESVKRIIIYLEELNNKYPDYKPELEDKLFRGLRTNKPLTANDFSGMFVYVNKAYSFRKTDDDRNLIKTHSLRKFFASTLERNKVPHLTTRRLLGHSIDSTTSAYFKVDLNSLKEDYLKVVNELMTIEQKVVVINRYGHKHEFGTLNGIVLESGYLPQDILDRLNYDEYKLNHEEYKLTHKGVY
ncbi:tyrosine-type recombinase/integrase [Methanobacterium aggregans]|uniref:tyrosine-type recombinase/integrase n=1 Tax=Methanobacterium aggregans TaxID=1615586 RepID=UPI001AE4CF02|nr:site-specific integrase [Methanobacterium aggregans]MBP2045854.1 integrase [Methanobacterium aggregans]